MARTGVQQRELTFSECLLCPRHHSVASQSHLHTFQWQKFLPLKSLQTTPGVSGWISPSLGIMAPGQALPRFVSVGMPASRPTRSSSSKPFLIVFDLWHLHLAHFYVKPQCMIDEILNPLLEAGWALQSLLVSLHFSASFSLNGQPSSLAAHWDAHQWGTRLDLWFTEGPPGGGP